MKSISVSKIDALIAELETKWKETCQAMYATHFTQPINLTSDEKIEIGAMPTVIKTLRGLEKESEEMIPLSAVEAFLKWMESFHDMVDHQYRDITGAVIMHIKEELTKDKDTKEREK